MFGYFNGSHIRQYIVTHRKHVKRRLFDTIEQKRHFSKFSKLGDLYARLGLTADVSQDEIKKAYYELSKEHHPDKNEGCSDSAEKFRSITEAYEILGNVTNRAEYDRETPYGRLLRRQKRYQTQSRPQQSSFYSEKDEELAEKIRMYRENMRKRSKRPSTADEEFTFRRENVFDFDAWYRAHFHDDFEAKQRSERIKAFEQQYREQMERIKRGERIQPPRRFNGRKEFTDIEMQMMEMENREFRKEISNLLLLSLTLIVGFAIFAQIIMEDSEKGPYVDRYAKEKENNSSKSKNE